MKCPNCGGEISNSKKVETVQVMVEEIYPNATKVKRSPKEFYCPACGHINTIEEEEEEENNSIHSIV